MNPQPAGYLWLLLIDAIMLGVALMVQLVVYPGLRHYSKEDLVTWHSSYTKRIAILVIPLMLGQLVGSITWTLNDASIGPLVYTGMIALLWGITLIRFAPLHGRISRDKSHDKLLKKLQHENWFRTILWIAAFLWHLSEVRFF